LPKRQSAFRAREIGKDRRAFFLHFRVFGILEMISTIEKEFRIQLDLADLDVEQITILGPLSRYVAGGVGFGLKVFLISRMRRVKPFVSRSLCPKSQIETICPFSLYSPPRL
jgi:hypothetical protein